MFLKNELEINKYLILVITDSIILIIFTVLSVIVFGFVGTLFDELIGIASKDSPIVHLLILTGFIWPWIFYYLVLFKKTGQTIAMRILSLKVIPLRGAKLPAKTALHWGIVLTNPFSVLLHLLIGPGASRYITNLELLTNTRLIDV